MKTKLVNREIKPGEDYTRELLKERGLSDEDITYFLTIPDDSALESPTKLKNIERARLTLLAISRLSADDRICVIVDCDVDGFTSAAIFIQYLRNFNKDVQIDYILHEGKGHGLEDTYDKIIEKWDENPNIKYVVVPDAGSNDYTFHEKLGELNITSLMLDHHIVESDTKFSTHAVIVNNQLSDNYINKDLCGAGVTWQLCRWFDRCQDTHYADDLIDLTALGIVSDMMSMLSLENRYIVNTGFNHITNYFFKVLCEKQAFSMGGKINPMTVAFYITPLINAMIRTGTMEEKERCFLAFLDGHQMVESHKRGAGGTYEEVAVESARECTNARARQNRILDKAVEELEIKIAKYDLLENKVLVIVLDEEDFPSELNGLCAMKLAAKYKKPTIVARLNEEGYVRGSSRGLNDSELKSFKDFMNQSGLFEYTAGHDNACGISIPYKSLKAFEEYGNKELANIDFGETWYEVNFERYSGDKDLTDIIENISQYEDIWGQHNPTPLIYITDICVRKQDISIIGKNADTVRIERDGVTYLKFHAKDMIEQLKDYNCPFKIDVVGKANMNYFAGNITPQIFIEDFQLKKLDLGF